MTVPQSWSSDLQLENLARLKRNREIVRGVITSVGTKKGKVLEEGKYVEKETEIAVFLLEGGVTAYCPANEFSDYEFKTLNGFTGTMQEFIIDHLDLEDKTAVVSVKKADQIKKEHFFNELESLEAAKKLNDKVFEGTVWGFNPRSRRVFVRINGADCFMMPNDWSWERRNLETEVDRGEKVQVKVLRFDRENNLIQVSRRHTIEDPFKKLERLKDMSTVAGKVSGVDPIHGIFVKLDAGLEVKGIKPSYLEEPIVGDIVSCTIRNIDRKKRHAKVVIVGYPRGKKNRKDLGSFLFE
ncbi:S1 RNA-binding domain-containing protein [Neobacillus notoginsengisoli]|uniref:S1 RNA-binding domain-containing protein n=1 Tax=Neobacillus notoginsengisoli TaxID=1578198 RepID=A0A417YPQ0_9BACI|nr:S1 RNA-binding domain-containing protein [Neobacillus notoginsengisoli]RHW35967.1 S1 RNA-binding domain-containing protein [Neobacillus notoginsengisoli]